MAHSFQSSQTRSRFPQRCRTLCRSRFPQEKLAKLDSVTQDSGVSPVTLAVVDHELMLVVGIKVNSSWEYDASLYFKFPTSSAFSGTLTLALQSSTGQTFAKATTTIHGSQTSWKQIQLKLRPSGNAPNTNNVFTVTLDAKAASGVTVNFAMLSLFPPTFKNRPNGMRVDIAEVRCCNACGCVRPILKIYFYQTLAEMGPAFFRFPGGNNLVSRQIPHDKLDINCAV